MNKYLRKLKGLLLGQILLGKKWKRLVTAMAMVVVFVTTYALILPAITLEKEEGKPEQGVYLDEMERGSTASLNQSFDETDVEQCKDGQTVQKTGKETDDTSAAYDEGKEDSREVPAANSDDNQRKNVSSTSDDGDMDDLVIPEIKEDGAGVGSESKNAVSPGRKQENQGESSGNPQHVYANGVYSAQGDGYTLSLDLKEEMKLPADVTISVEEIKENYNNAAVYNTYMAAAKRAAARNGRGEFTSVRFLKFALFSNGKEVRTNQDIDVLVVPVQKDKVRNGDKAHVLIFRGSIAHMFEDVNTQMSGYRVSAYRFLYPSSAIDQKNWGLLGLAVTEPKPEEKEGVLTDTADHTEEDSSIEDEQVSTEETEVTTSTEDRAASTEETAVSTEEAVATTEETEASTEEAVATTEETAVSTEEAVATTEETEASTEEAVATTEETAVSTEEAVATTEETEASTEEAVATTEETEASTEETEASTEETAATEERTETEPASTEAVEENRKAAKKLEFKGKDYQVVMTCDEKAGIPEGAVLQVTEIPKDSEDYEKYLQEASETLEMNKMASPTARFFDIKIMDGKKEIEPAVPVSVEIIYDKPMEVKEGEKVDALHFGEKKTEVIEDIRLETEKGQNQEIKNNSEKDQNQDIKNNTEKDQSQDIKSVTFEAESFSVYGILTYTVDFTFDGYSYSIEGNSTIRLSKLVEILEIAGKDKDYETGMAFVKDVEEVTFTDESLVKVEKAGLFGTDIFSWGDWELISLNPFDTEETLTIVMKDGIRYEIKVTDAQMKKTVISASGETYKITVTYDGEAKIPDGAELYVKEILPEDKEYQDYYEKALEKAEAQTAAPDWDKETAEQLKKLATEYGRFFDIEIRKGKEKIEPKSEVLVDIKLLDAPDQNKLKPMVIHFAKNDMEVMESTEPEIESKGTKPGDTESDAKKEGPGSETKEPEAKDTKEGSETTELQFKAKEFSVYSVMYTVDFHYSANGKNYDFGIPGGGFVTLQQLVEALGIAGSEASSENVSDTANEENFNPINVIISETTKKFVADVASVEFSSPDLVWIGKTEETVTVGQLKETNKLECQYSAELTKEQIEEINSSKVESGDWALISVRPFISKEDLTVTMKNGDQFVVKVTDHQISTNALTADGKTYRITVTFDDSAEIPIGTRLEAEEISQGSEEFIQYVAKTLEEVNRDYFEQQEQLRKGVDPDSVESVQPVSIDQARFFHVTLMYEGREIEPKSPVQVDIEYVDGLGVRGIDERIPGISHFTSDIVEVISKVSTETDEKGRIVEFEYTQDSFSDIGTFIGHEAHDRRMTADAPDVNLGNRSSETPTIEDFIAENGAPEASKALNDNGDGTYTLALHVNPQSIEYTKSKKSNVLFIMDRSSSMDRNSYDSYLEFETEEDALAALNNSENVYGNIDGIYTPLSYLVTDYGGFWTSASGVYDTSNGLYYGLSGSRFAQEQAALGNLINQLMAKNEGQGNENNVEISVISFATYAGNEQKYTYVGGTSTSNWGGTSAHQNDPAYRWRDTEIGWTGGTDATPLINGVNRLDMARGTNWEEALRYAKVVMDDKKSTDGTEEDYYVVFLTDGAPTATSWSITQHEPEYEWGAWYGNNGGAGYQNNQGLPYAYEPARDEAAALVNADYKLYNVFTYGEGTDYNYLIRLTNYAYSGGTNDTTTATEPVNKYFKNAVNTSELVDYFNKIFADITINGNIGHSQVKIKDGLTTGAMTSTFVNGKPSAVRYTVTPGQGSTMLPYTVQVTMPEEGTEPVVTFTINGHDYTTTSGAVQKKENPAGAYDAGEYYSVKVNGVEYKMALASVTNGGELTWDLTPLGVLWDDCDYKAEFVVWPKQEAYNYVAGLNNEMPGFVWDQETADDYEQIDSEGRKYWSHGVAAYPSIVKYEDGTFAVLTNTHQEMEYSVSQVEDDELIDESDPTTELLDSPDPMPLTATRTNLEKQWNVDRNPAILAQYLYNPDGSPTEFVAMFDISSDDDANPFATVSLGWDSDLGQYVWDESTLRRVVYNGHVFHIGTRWSDEINIATGLMLSGARMEALGLNPAEYPKATYEGKTYYILERGHDYHVEENADGDELGYQFDFESPVFHPMLVDGRMVNIVFRDEMNEQTLSLTTPYPIEKMVPAPMNSIGSLVVENTLRGYINVEKIVMDKDGKTIKSDDTTKFSYDVVLENSMDPGPFTEEGFHIPWYGIDGLFYHAELDGKIYYFQAEPLGGSSLSLTTESGETYTAETTSGDVFDPDIVGPTEITYMDENDNPVLLELYGNQMDHESDNRVSDTIQITHGQTLNIANVPKGTTYTITESILDPNYDLMSIVWRIKDGDTTISRGQVEDISSGSITGEIVSNRDNRVIFTNKIHSADLKVKKVDENGKVLLGAKFQLTKAIVEPETEAQTWTLPEPGTADTGMYTFADLPDGVYTLTETPPANYTGVEPITFAVANGVIYMPGDTLPAGVSLPDDAVLPAGVTWNNNQNKTFMLTIPNTHIQPGPDEIRVEKHWVDENGDTAEGSRDVKVQLRRKKLDSHKVTVVFHSDRWSGGAEINDSTTFQSIAGDQITIEFAKPINFAQNVAPPISSTSGTVQGPNSNGSKWKIVVNGVSSDITVTIDYSGYNWQLVNQNNNPPIQNTVTVVGNGQGGGDYVPDSDFPSTDEDKEKATKTLHAPDYFASWKFGEGSNYDFQAAGYQYYIVELDENDQPIQENQGGLVSISNNDGITTGIITATDKINGSLTLKKELSALENEDVSLAAGKYNFTVTGPGESGTTRYVQIRIDEAGSVTYKVSKREISFDETDGFVNAPSDGTVLIPDLIAGKYKVTEDEFQLDDQSGKYTTNLGKIEVESGTADVSTGSATLNVRAENTPSAAATFTNMLVPMMDVPVVKTWNWSTGDDGDQGRVASWTATFNLEYREVLVSGEAASDAQHSWTPVYDTDGTTQTQKSVTIRSTDDPQEKFTNLPLYKNHDNGSVYRLIYAVDEVAYTINWNDGSPQTVWNKNESGHLSEHYSPDYEQDAGESEKPENQEDWDEWYTIRLKNVKSMREIEKTIDLSLEKFWEDEELQTDPDSKATFQLKRTYHEEYLDYNRYELDPDDLVTIKLDLGNGAAKQLVVPRGAPFYVTAVVKPGKTANLRFSKDGSEFSLSGPDGESTSQQFIRTSTPFLANTDGDEVIVSYLRGDTSVLVGGLDGLGLASFDPDDTTEEQEDEAFNNPLSQDGQSAGQKFTLDAEHGWQKEWAGLPQLVEELSVTDSGTRMKTIVYSYYLVEIEEECYPKNYKVSFRNGQGDEENPLISSGSVVAENKLETTELEGTKTWSIDNDSSYVLGTPILKLSRRTETTMVDDEGNPVTILSDPEDVTVSWEGEEQYLQPTWQSGGGLIRSFIYTELPKCDKDGKTYVYSVEEVEFTVGAGGNEVVYTAVRQPDGTYIVTPDKEGARMFVVRQTGNDIVNELQKMTIEIVKIDESTRDEETPERIANASFRLLKYNGTTYVGYDGPYGAEDGVWVGENGTEKGKLTFEDLPSGEYKIVEIHTPDGYIKTENNDIYFRIGNGVVTRYDSPAGTPDRAEILAAIIVNEGDDPTVNIVEGISYISDSAHGKATFTVGNTPGSALPSTGGPGTYLFYLSGCILMMLVGASVVIWRRRRETA